MDLDRSTLRWTNSIQINSIQFNSIQFNSIQFNSIQFNSIQLNSIQFNSNSLLSTYPRTVVCVLANTYLSNPTSALQRVRFPTDQQRRLADVCLATYPARWRGWVTDAKHGNRVAQGRWELWRVAPTHQSPDHALGSQGRMLYEHSTTVAGQHLEGHYYCYDPQWA